METEAADVVLVEELPGPGAVVAGERLEVPGAAAAATLPAGFRPGGVMGERTKGGAIGARHMVLIDQIIAWSIGNPGQSWSRCAASLGLSKIFVTAITASDAFRERYMEVRDKTLEEVGILPLKEKIAAAADVALERLTEKISTCESVSELKDTTDMLLTQVYGEVRNPTGGTPPQQQNNIFMISQAIAEGRSAMLSRGKAPAQVLEVPVETPVPDNRQ